jgi:Cu(I)/Ag(I) efflux system membrane fusion protein
MAATRRGWLGWLAVLAGVAAVAGGLWYAYAQGWLGAAYDRVRQLASKDTDAEVGMGGMNMPGMGMGGMSEAGPPSGVPGFAPVVVEPGLQQRIGVKVGRVEKGPLLMSVRTVGIVQPDETKMARVHLRTEGWVARLVVNFTGQQVKQGDPLLEIYSPQFVTTQQEYLSARSAGNKSLAETARQRLRLWGVSPEELEKLDERGKPLENLVLRSPQAGTVLERNVLEGEYVTPQKELYVIADLSTVWVQAKVYEYELPHVEHNQPAAVTVPALPGQTFQGKVVFVQPTLEEATRTVRVRVVLDNPKGLFKPGMFAHVEIRHAMGEGLLVPTSAVIRTGERDIAFRVEPAGGKGPAQGGMNHVGMAGTEGTDHAKMGHANDKGPNGAGRGDRFVPVEVKIDTVRYLGDRFHVLAGLKAGDRVVTSANFLIDSESRLRAGGGGMMNMPGMDMGDMKGMPGMKKEGDPKNDPGGAHQHGGAGKKGGQTKDQR